MPPVIRTLRAALVAVLVALPGAGNLPAQAAPAADWTAELDGFIRRGMADWEIPGLSVAVVRNDSVVFLRGYGVRRLGADGPVDTRTLFGMMSTTKALTATCLGMLVDDGRLSWNDPVSRWVPEFAMPEPYVTGTLRVIDLLTHSAGLGGADLLWVRGDLTAPEIFQRLRLLTPAYPLRGGFIYQNIMYALAGEVVARASGMSYGEFLRRRLFNPLGMTRSYSSLASVRAAADPNTSAPHYLIRDTVRVIDETDADAIAPAGAGWSTAEDMALWVRFLLDSARTAGGQRLLSDTTFAMLFTPRVVIPPDEFYSTATLTHPHWQTYALGWFEQDYRGEFVAFHTGSLAGRTAIVGLLPDRHVGVYAFGNLDHAEFRHALMLKVFDLALGGGRDWNADLLTLYPSRRGSAAAAESALAADRIPGTRPTLPLAAYAGRYVSPLWGDIEVTADSGGLSLKIGSTSELAGPLEHYHYDTFLARLGDGRDAPSRVLFVLGPDGAVAELRLPEVAREGFVRVR